MLRSKRELSAKRYVYFSNRPIEVKHFQAIHHSSVDVARGIALLFGLGTKALPSWDLKARWNNLLGDLAVNVTAGSSGQANAINATLSSFRVKTVPELIAYAKANPGKITMARLFSVCPAVAPTKLEDLKERDQQLEPLRAEQRKALEKHGRGLSARSIRSATSGANSINKSLT